MMIKQFQSLTALKVNSLTNTRLLFIRALGSTHIPNKKRKARTLALRRINEGMFPQVMPVGG